MALPLHQSQRPRLNQIDKVHRVTSPPLFQTDAICARPGPAKLILEIKSLPGRFEFEVALLKKMNPACGGIAPHLNRTRGPSLPASQGLWTRRRRILKEGNARQSVPKCLQYFDSHPSTKNQLYPQPQPRNAASSVRTMKFLVSATLIWAFSFSLIGVYLSGQVDPWFAAWFRTALALLLFLPLMLRTRLARKEATGLAGIGAVQLGLMYLFYYQSFEHLTVPEVLIFTILTPLYVTLINDLFARRFAGRYLLTAALAVLGTAVIRWGAISPSFVFGFLLVQGSNLCFAFGQIGYRYLRPTASDAGLFSFGYFYLGAFLITSLAYAVQGTPQLPTTATQWIVLVWLGLVASGAGYYLWNRGARAVNAGALAIMNNALVPAGLLVNVLIWNREVDLLRLGIGSAIIVLSLWINHRSMGRREPGVS